MFVSNYTYNAQKVERPTSFFSNFGNYPELQKDQSEITNFYKQYTWIQTGDSFLRKVGKIALAIMTFSASLWITSYLDTISQGERQDLFDQKVQKTKEKIFGQTMVDLFRQTIYVDGKNLYERGFEMVEESDLPEADRPTFQQLRKEGKTLEEILENKHPLAATLRDSVKNKVEEEVLPNIFRRLEEGYGTLKALQALDGMAQTISNQMWQAFHEEYIEGQLEAADEGPLKKGCFISGQGLHEITSLDFKKGELKLNRGLKMFTTDDVKGERVLAELGADIWVDIGEFNAESFFSITPTEELRPEEIKKLNRVWEEFGFQMPVPVSPSGPSDSN